MQDETKSNYELAHAIKDKNTTLIYLTNKMAQSGPSQVDIVAAIKELDLDLTLEVRALGLLNDPQVANQFLAFLTKDRRRACLMAELALLRIVGLLSLLFCGSKFAFLSWDSVCFFCHVII